MNEIKITSNDANADANTEIGIYSFLGPVLESVSTHLVGEDDPEVLVDGAREQRCVHRQRGAALLHVLASQRHLQRAAGSDW